MINVSICNARLPFKASRIDFIDHDFVGSSLSPTIFY